MKLFICYLVLLAPFVFALDEQWHTYFEGLENKVTDLGNPDEFAEFVKNARFAYPRAKFFHKKDLSEFLQETVNAIIDDENQPGIVYAAHICKYFSISSKSLPKISENVDLSTSARETLLEIYANLEIEPPEVLIPLEESSLKKYGILFHFQSYFDNFRECKLEDISKDLSVRNIALYLADGALEHEVDLTGAELEGQTSAAAACALSQFLYSAAQNSPYLDKTEAEKLAGKFRDVNTNLDILKSLLDDPNILESYEFAVIQQLRELKLNDDVLLALGFTKHAMSMSVKKVENRHYDIMVFNSGAGLEYHQSVAKGSRPKYFPGILYKNVPLSKLKSVRFFQKIAEIKGKSSLNLKDIEPQSITSDAKTLYKVILACLRLFKYTYTKEDINKFALIPPQRSGTCSIRALLAYMAEVVRGKFRLYKLCISKNLFEIASEKAWSPEDSVILARFLKFGIENYGRSLDKFMKHQNPDSIALSAFWNEKIISLYKYYSRPKVVNRPHTFRIETDGAMPSTEYFVDLIEKGKLVESAFAKFELETESLSITESEKCKDWRLLAHKKFEGDPKQIEAVLNLVSDCFTSVGNDYQLAFLLSTVLYHWPMPSLEHDVYDILLPKDDMRACEENMEVLFKVVKKILKFARIHNRGHYSIYGAMLKFLAIYQKAFSGIFPDINKSLTHRLDSYDLKELFTCPDSGVFSQMDQVRSMFGGTEYPFNRYDQSLNFCWTSNAINCLCRNGPLIEYMRSMVDDIEWGQYSSYDDEEKRISALFNMRLQTKPGKSIPAHHYFWRVISKIVQIMDYNGSSRPSNFLVLTEDYSPLKDECSQNYVSFKSKSDKFDTELKGLTYLNEEYQTLKFDRDVLFRPEEFKVCRNPVAQYSNGVHETTLHRLKQYGISDSELGIYINITYGEERKDKLGTYSHLIQDAESSLSWFTLVVLGTELIQSSSKEQESELAYLLTVLNNIGGNLLTKLMRAKKALEDPQSTDPNLTAMAIRISGILVLQAEAGFKIGKPIHAENLRKQLANLIDENAINGSYGLYMMLGYILSIQNGNLSLDEAKNVIRYNSKIAGLENKLNVATDKSFYLFAAKIVVSRAMFVLEQAHQNDPTAIDGLVKNIDSSSLETQLPWIRSGKNFIFNVLTGSLYLNSFLAGYVTVESIGELKKQAKLEYLPRLDYESITKQGKGGAFLTITSIKDGSRPKVKTTSGGTVDINQIHYLEEPGSLHIRALLSDGRVVFLLNHKDIKWSDLPLPAPTDGEKKYNVFVNPAQKIVVAFDAEETIWMEDGKLSTISNKLEGYSRLLHQKNLEALAVLNPLSDIHEVELYSGSDDFALNFKEYSDLEHKSLWFQQDSTGNWIFNNEQKFMADPDQTFVGHENLLKYLVIRTKEDQRKILLPIEHMQINKAEKPREAVIAHSDYSGIDSSSGKKGYKFKFSGKNRGSKKRCMQISLSSSGSLVPQSRWETLLLAYHYLVSRRYVKSFEMLRKVHQMEELSNEELRLLAWIMISGSAIKDGSPDSVAVRSYASFIVLSNSLLFGHIPFVKAQNERKESRSQQKNPPPDPYAPTEFWSQFWADEMKNELVSKTVDRYFRLINKVPAALRFDVKSKRNILTKFEERTWLDELTGENIQLYTGGHLFQRLSSPEQDQEEKIVDSLPPFSRTDLNGEMPDKLSAVHSFKFTDGNFKKLFSAMLFGRESEKDEFELAGFLEGLQKTNIGLQAYAIRKAIFSKSLSREYSRSFDAIFQDYKKRQSLVTLQEVGFETKDFVLVQDVPVGKFIIPESPLVHSTRRRKDTPLETIVLNDQDLGFNLSVAEIKKMLINSEEDKLINAVNDLSFFSTPEDYSVDKFTFEPADSVEAALKQAIKAYKSVVKALELNIKDLFTSRDHAEKSLERIAYGVLEPDRDTLLHLYTHADLKMYRQYVPTLSSCQCQEVHDEITLLALAISNQNDLKRLRKAYMKKDKDSLTYEIELKERDRNSATTDNAIMAYEIFINSRLTKQQVEDIALLTQKYDGKFANYLIQRIMSAGKTFVLGTILAHLKADRNHLSVLVVPRALYTRESANLIRRTINAFGSEGFSFKISRKDSDETGQCLEWISEMLKKAREQGIYVILPPETLLTMQNKMIEYKIGRNDHSSKLDEILGIFKTYGAGTFDEIHAIFNPTQELNFPITKETDPEGAIELQNQALLLCELFNILKTESIQKIADVKRNVELLPDGYSVVKKDLVRKAVEMFKKSDYTLPLRLPLQELSEKTPDFDVLLSEFLTVDNLTIQQSTISFMQTNMNSESYRLLCVGRMFITDWLPLAWSGNVNEHYGLSENTIYAIPYASSGVPKEGSEYSLRWLTYVRTIRTYLVGGLNEHNTKDALGWLQKQCFGEIEASGRSGESEYERLLLDLFNETPFSLDLTRQSDVIKHVETAKLLHHNPTDAYTRFLFMYISSSVIPSVRYYDEQISSNAQDFTFMFDTIQGYTGTVYSTRTLPPYFMEKKNRSLDKDIEKRITEKILKDSNFPVITIPSGKTANEFLNFEPVTESMVNLKDHPFNAIIDVGAYFKDETNESVANALLSKQDGVFFFSSAKETKSKLALLAKSSTGVSEKILESMARASIEIAVKDSSKRVTFYDQSNTTGVDIFQHDDGYAFVIIGLKTTSNDFFQAVMRMRKLLFDQRIVLVIPDVVEQTLRDVLGVKGEITVRDVIDYTRHNMNSILKKYNGAALLQMIRAKCKSVVFDALLSNENNRELKTESLNIFMKNSDVKLEAFVSRQENKDWDKYIDEYIQSCMNKINHFIGDREQFLQEVNNLKSLAFGKNFSKYYDENVLAACADDSDQMVENEAEAQAENLLELTCQVDEGYSRSELGFSRGKIDWAKDEFPRADLNLISKNQPEEEIFSVNDLLDVVTLPATGRRLRIPPLFSDKLFVTLSTIDFGSLFGSYRSFIYNVLFLRKDNDLRAVMVTNQEVSEIEKVFKEKGSIFGYEAAVVSTSGDFVKMGHFEADKEKKNLLAEVLIFAGSSSILDRKEWSEAFSSWLDVDKSTRSAFYMHFILSNTELRKVLSTKALPQLDRSATMKILEGHEHYHDYMLLNVINGKYGVLSSYMGTLLSAAEPDYEKIFEVTLITSRAGKDKDNSNLIASLKILKSKFLLNEPFLTSVSEGNNVSRMGELAVLIIHASSNTIASVFFKMVTKLLSELQTLKKSQVIMDAVASAVGNRLRTRGNHDLSYKLFAKFLNAIAAVRLSETDQESFSKMLDVSVLFDDYNDGVKEAVWNIFKDIDDEGLLLAYLGKAIQKRGLFAHGENQTLKKLTSLLRETPSEDLQEILVEAVGSTLQNGYYYPYFYKGYDAFKKFEFNGINLSEQAWFIPRFISHYFKQLKQPKDAVWFFHTISHHEDRPKLVDNIEYMSIMASDESKAEETQIALPKIAEYVKEKYNVDV